MATLLEDNFNRANSAVAIGSPQVGGPYTQVLGTWGINANRAYVAAAASSARLTAPGAFNVEGQFTLGLATSGSSIPTIMFRYVDADNYWRLNPRAASGEVGLQLVRANSASTIGPTFVYDGAAGHVLKFKAYGNRIQFWVDGVLVGDVVDPVMDPAGTKIGLMNQSASTGYWDDVLFADSTPFPDWGASPEGFDGVEVDFDAQISVTPSFYKGRDTATADESEIP